MTRRIPLTRSNGSRVDYDVYDIKGWFDPVTGAVNLAARAPHANSPQVIKTVGGHELGIPRQFTAQHHHGLEAPGAFDPERAIYNVEYLRGDGTIVLGEITGGPVLQTDEPLPIVRLVDKSPRVINGLTKVQWFDKSGMVERKSIVAWEHHRLTDFLGPDPVWAGKYYDPHWFTLVENADTPGHRVFICYVMARVAERDYRIVQYWRASEPDVACDDNGDIELTKDGKHQILHGVEHIARGFA